MNLVQKIDRSKYICFCGGCICQHCSNNVECLDKGIESDFGCFNCDYCKGYDKKEDDNWKSECCNYKITDVYAKTRRKKFKLMISEGRN